MKIHNTLTRKKEEFEPEQDTVTMYICGPTVYDDCHIGHLMGPILFDTIARWIKWNGYKVHFANNITDIDDKIINRSIKTGEPWLDITKRYTGQYFDFLKSLNVTSITDFPKCSEYMEKIIKYIDELISDDKAYSIEEGVYYDISKQENYGKLSGRKLEDMIAGSRIARSSSLKHPADFCLWKPAKEGEPSWESPWGNGRPGWHIECTVMATAILGSKFDIHGGGDDLKFPHHENEIAQAEAHGDGYADIWMHNGLIQYEGAKISKSDPRMKDKSFSIQFNAKYLVDTFTPEVVRFFLLQGHYRRPFDFAPENIKSAGKAYNKLKTQIKDIANEENDIKRELPEDLAKIRDKFIFAMNDDFNTGSAISNIFTMSALAKKTKDETTKQEALKLIKDCGKILGLFYTKEEKKSEPQNDDTLDKVLKAIIEIRQEAKENRNFELSDTIRNKMQDCGIIIKDSKDGATWEKV